MLLKSKIARVVCALCLVFSVTILAFADTIRLKDGSIIKGKIVSFGAGKFTIQIGSGVRIRQMDFTADEVESISFDSNYAAANNTAAATVPTRTISAPINTPTAPAVRPAPTVSVTRTENISAAKPEPVKISVKVLADNTSNGWTNSGFVVQKGQKIRVFGDGRISLGSGRMSPPSGIPALTDASKLMANEATGALIAVVGDDNNDFIFVGDAREFTATRDGALFLGVNESNLNDNSGSYNVRVEIDPNR